MEEFHLNPAQVLVAKALQDPWDTPIRLWQTLRTSLCWHIWKDRNKTIFTNRSAAPEKVIHKSWHRIGTQVKIEWCHLLSEIRANKINFMEAKDRMAYLFGKEGVVWELEDVRIQVPPCPPRPP